MMSKHRRPAFTLIELLVVVAIISMLIGILLPSLSHSREQARAAVCLSNMRQIGILMQAYTIEDSADQSIPIHAMMVRETGSPWLWGTANDFVWGGRDGQRTYVQDSTAEIWLTGDELGYIPPGLDYPAYDMVCRPLNKYVLGANFTESDRDDMEIFACPSDSGYPTAIDVCDVPPSACAVPCYDLFGNSYRANTRAVKDDTGAFSVSPWGHRATTLPNTSEAVLFAEPLFYNMISGGSAGSDWHNRAGVANVSYADGAARATRNVCDPGIQNGVAELLDLPVSPPWCNKGLIHTGLGWALDVWPTPGARIWGEPGLWTPPFNAPAFSPCAWKLELWPFLHYQDNLATNP